MEGNDDEDGEGKGEKIDSETKEEKTEGGEKEKDSPMELEAEDDVDPLDAYMEEVKQEVKKFNIGAMKGNDKVRIMCNFHIELYIIIFIHVSSLCSCLINSTVPPQQKGAMTVTKVVTVVKTKKGPHTHKKKGELMENDQDAMEVIFPPSKSIVKITQVSGVSNNTEILHNHGTVFICPYCFHSTRQRRRRWIYRQLSLGSGPNRGRSWSLLTTKRFSMSLIAKTSTWRSLSLPR